MTQEELLKEINAIYKKKKDGAASEEELARYEVLKKEYLSGFRAMLTQTLDNTVIEYPDGSREYVKDRKKR